MARVRLLSVNPSMEHIEMTKREFVIGRAPGCDLVLESPVISKRHCRFLNDPERGIMLQDMSSNGTYVRRASETRREPVGRGTIIPLNHGDEVALVLPSSPDDVFSDTIVAFLVHALTPANAMMIEEMEEHRVLERLRFRKELASGSFGVVWDGVDLRSDERVAVKVIRKQQAERLGTSVEQMLTEAYVLHELRHPHVIGVKDVLFTPKYLIIVMEFADRGDLDGLMQKYPRLREPAARVLFHSLLTGLAYLHERNVIHRDLKPQNVLLTGGNPADGVIPTLKLTDFGLAKVLGEEATTTTICGTPMYMAPEVLARGIGGVDKTGRGYGKESDLWSAGLILYQMLTGGLPWSTRPGSEPLSRQLSYGLRPDFALVYPDFVSDEARDLINSLVCSPEKRLAAAEVLTHPWLKPAAARAVDDTIHASATLLAGRGSEAAGEGPAVASGFAAGRAREAAMDDT